MVRQNSVCSRPRTLATFKKIQAKKGVLERPPTSAGQTQGHWCGPSSYKAHRGSPVWPGPKWTRQGDLEVPEKATIEVIWCSLRMVPAGTSRAGRAQNRVRGRGCGLRIDGPSGAALPHRYRKGCCSLSRRTERIPRVLKELTLRSSRATYAAPDGTLDPD